MNEELGFSEVVEALETISEVGLPAHGLAHLTDVGSEAYVSYFKSEVLSRLLGRGGSTCKFLEGAYGSGKTHLLQMLAELGLRNGCAVCQIDLSRALSLTDWKAITQEILTSLQAVVGGQRVESYPRILEAARYDGSADPVAVRELPAPHEGFRKASELILSGAATRTGAARVLERFLLGEKVRVGDLRDAGISGVKGPLTQRNSEHALRTVLACLRCAGFAGVILLFDENEKTFVINRNRPSRAVVNGANFMRRMIDAATNGSLVSTVAVFAVLPGFIQNCALAYDALGQRLEAGRNGHLTASWRWPVIYVDEASSFEDEEAFSAAAIEKLVSIAEEHLESTTPLWRELNSEAIRTLAGNAGTGVRRELMKALATVTLEHLEGRA